MCTGWGDVNEGVTGWGRNPEPLQKEKLSKIRLTDTARFSQVPEHHIYGCRVQPRGASNVLLHSLSHCLLFPPWLWRGKKANLNKSHPWVSLLLLLPPEGLVRILAAPITPPSHHCHRLFVTMPPTISISLHRNFLTLN